MLMFSKLQTPCAREDVLRKWFPPRSVALKANTKPVSRVATEFDAVLHVYAHSSLRLSPKTVFAERTGFSTLQTTSVIPPTS